MKRYQHYIDVKAGHYKYTMLLMKYESFENSLDRTSDTCNGGAQRPKIFGKKGYGHFPLR